jgi:catechol 2,3-dioxygenase-like lactoylglutathione lyase family enzyme
MTLRCDLAGMVVADMAKSLAFYRRLGLDLPAELDEQPHVDVELPGGFRLAWDTIDVIKSFDPTWSAPSGRGTTLAFTCDTPAEVDATYADLVGAGYEGHLEPWDAFWGMRYAVVVDPDGNHVDLAALLPTS